MCVIGKNQWMCQILTKVPKRVKKTHPRVCLQLTYVSLRRLSLKYRAPPFSVNESAASLEFTPSVLAEHSHRPVIYSAGQNNPKFVYKIHKQYIFLIILGLLCTFYSINLPLLSMGQPILNTALNRGFPRSPRWH